MDTCVFPSHIVYYRRLKQLTMNHLFIQVKYIEYMLTSDLLKSIWNIFQSLFWLCQLPRYQSCCIVLLDEIGHTATLQTSITSLANSITFGWRTESITLGKKRIGSQYGVFTCSILFLHNVLRWQNCKL